MDKMKSDSPKPDVPLNEAEVVLSTFDEFIGQERIKIGRASCRERV